MADTLTISDLTKLAELQAEIFAIREQLKPKYESIQKRLQALDIGDDLKFLMDFEGKPTFKSSVEWNGQQLEVIFKMKKVG
uniref:Uncharacterized protein n=1 Tax=viral metagenome TaxID=1070528 RepID=A0A6M3LR31_9ZZZZ